ncbi:hypothetical protein PM082_016332 [Marasmius tenuissimus]|nr:hypothetical protein PM082_016332 [Marasmius tenuissimus]
MPLFLLGGGPALDSPVPSYDHDQFFDTPGLGDDPFEFVNTSTSLRSSRVNLHLRRSSDRTNCVAFPSIQTPPSGSGSGSSASIATTKSSDSDSDSDSSFSTTTTSNMPSGAVVPRAAPGADRHRMKQKKKPSFTDRRGYNLCIDLSGTAKRFGNHSGRCM